MVVVTSDGHVSAYHGGSFYSVCADNWSSEWSAGLCRHVGAGLVMSTSMVALRRSVYLSVFNGSVFNISQLILTTTCNTTAGVHVVCHQPSCGLSSTTIQPFIVGGEIAADNAWPWAAVLLYKGVYKCTASVIGNGWLLSAAHCFYATQPLVNVPQYFAVRLGSVLSRGYSRNLRVSSVRRIVVHPDYTVDVTTNIRYNDIALVQLGDDLLTPATTTTSTTSSNSGVTSVCLIDNDKHSLATLKTWQCYVIGWGLSNVDGDGESLLMMYHHCTLH